MTNEERGSMYMQRNVKLSPALVALTWDIFFFWTISTLYLTQVKGLTNSQVIMLDSVLMIFGGVFCDKIHQSVPVIAAEIVRALS